MILDIKFEENYKELINHLIKDDEVWIPFSSFEMIEYFLLEKKKIHLNFNIKNMYFIWHYVINNIELLESCYNNVIEKDSKIITNLSTKSDKPIVRASSSLAIINNRISKEMFNSLSEYDFSMIQLHYNEKPESKTFLFQDLHHLNLQEIIDVSELDNRKIITTTNDKNLLHFNGSNAVKTNNNYILWN